jgi:hypothetical protein
MPHAKAVVAGRTIAETDDYEVVEGNIYVCILSCLTLNSMKTDLFQFPPSYVETY